MKDFRQIIRKKEEHIDFKMGELSKRQRLSKLPPKTELLMAFDPKSLYPSAMVVEGSTFPRVETRFEFEKHMETKIIGQFNSGISTKRGFLKKKITNLQTWFCN